MSKGFNDGGSVCAIAAKLIGKVWLHIDFLFDDWLIGLRVLLASHDSNVGGLLNS